MLYSFKKLKMYTGHLPFENLICYVEGQTYTIICTCAKMAKCAELTFHLTALEAIAFICLKKEKTFKRLWFFMQNHS